jgi:hypothetical protein
MMRKKSILLLLTIIGFAIANNGTAQDIKFIDYTSNTNPKNFKRILIVGAGSIASRLFLENLSNKLIDNLKKRDLC